jgi:hypothetical protein
MWTNVNAKLPKPGRRVLVTVSNLYNDRSLELASYNKKGVWTAENGAALTWVLAWAPLPRAWRGK